MTSVMACTSRGFHVRSGLAHARLCSMARCGGLGRVWPSPSFWKGLPQSALHHHTAPSSVALLLKNKKLEDLANKSLPYPGTDNVNSRRTFSTGQSVRFLPQRFNDHLGRFSLDRYYSSGNLFQFRNEPMLQLLVIDSSFSRRLHASARRLKDESKVEETLEAIKEQIKEKSGTAEQKPTQPLAAEQPKATPTAGQQPMGDKTVVPQGSVESMAVAKPPPPKKSLKERVVDELKHYYHGFRLFVIDIRVAARLMWQVLKGKNLSRREQKQLVRTTADMFRMVPFLVFIIIPFAEFLLPVALKLFPGMLPSTFQEADKEREKQRKRLQVKLEMAKFLQDTIEEMALQQKKGGNGEKSVQEFGEFLNKIRTSGTQTSTEEIMKFSKLFEDEITLDNLSYNQLSALCKLLEVPPVGTSGFLRFQLEMKLRQLAADDKMIVKEGLDSMAVWELQDACRMRGMRAIGLPEERLKTQLAQWLDLHLNRKVPTSLLLLSRTLYLPEHLSAEEQIKATISTLPDSTAEEAKVKILEVAGERVDNKSKLEIIRQEEEIIMKEKIERDAKQQEEQKLKDAEAARQKVKVEEESKIALGPPTSATEAPPDVKPEEVLVDKAKVLEERPEETISSSISDTARVTDVTADKAEEIDSTDLNQIENILERVAEVNPQAEDLQTLKEDFTEYQENLEDLRGVVATSGGEVELKESVAARRLGKKVSKLIQQIDVTMADMSKKTEALMDDIRAKEKHIEALPATGLQIPPSQQEKLDLCTEKRRFITIVELMQAVKSASDSAKLEKIIKVLDEDQDGNIDVADALKVIELLGRENMKLYPDQLTEIMTILHKENEIEEEEKRLKKLQQAAEQTTLPLPEAVVADAAATSTAADSAKTATAAEKKPAATKSISEKSDTKNSKESQRI